MSAGIAQKIKLKMEERNLTARELERVAGLKISAVTNILTGKSKNPRADTLYNIAEVLNCSVDDLMSEDLPSYSSLIVDKWNLSLFMSAAEIVDQCVQEKKKDIPFPAIIKMIKEVYSYSLSRGELKADPIFARWVAERNIR